MSTPENRSGWLSHWLSLWPSSRVAAALVCSLAMAAPVAAQETARSFEDMLKGVPLVPPGKHESELLGHVSAAVGFIQRMQLQQAQQAVNEALQLDPRHSQLHFLNGFVYHLQARQGDTQKGELAREGYQQALRIDPSNWIAQEFLGLVHMDLKQFDLAKTAFAEVLLLTPESAVSINGLMVASYLTGDAKTACAMAEQFRKLQASAQTPLQAPLPEQRAFVRSSVAVYAACGSFGEAARMRAALSQFSDSSLEVERVDRRLAQWQAVYDRAVAGSAPGLATTSAFLPASGMALKTSFTPVKLAQAAGAPGAVVKSGAAVATVAVAAAATAEAPAGTPPAAAVRLAAPEPASAGPRMLLVDVVLLSTQELAYTSKGVNLLSALTLQLGSLAGNVAAYSRVVTSSTANEAAANVSTAITRAVTVPALSYSLNIANANNSVNEVLARPTLAAIEGLPSEFFSGTNLSAGVVSTSQQGGTTIVPLDKRFGIKLAVTPSFLPEGRVQLKVEAQRTSLNASSENPRVAYQIEIAETTANANVVMNLGDTLVLSGLSEKSSSSTRDGVPGLQEVPGVQYLFSNKKTNDIQRSVLILVTPRAPAQVAEAGAGEPLAERMRALRERFGFSGGNPTNVDAVLNQLQGNDLFREFRQGDVALERWERMRTTGDRLKEALGFLYY